MKTKLTEQEEEIAMTFFVMGFRAAIGGGKVEPDRIIKLYREHYYLALIAMNEAVKEVSELFKRG